MALFRGLSGAIGDAFVTTLDWSWPRIAPRVVAAARVIAVDAVRPEPPMTLRTLDAEPQWRPRCSAARFSLLFHSELREPPRMNEGTDDGYL